ncbi:MAG: thiazole synthase [Xanthobacteraceae bacterium]|nr:thiazole synthase [Xanthobacteraceae bacterium]QYK44333.1 MAG: thiazole synthase [Xanthobacteraceae bacterium]HMN52480.1 thiazole synthase [Xanthobacteraceae bacterium]
MSKLNLYGEAFDNRLLIGTARYPSLSVMQEAVKVSSAEIVTVSVRRENAGGKDGDTFWNIIRELNVKVLPNTAGCYSVEDAVNTAQLARELFDTKWIKLEVLGDRTTLQPDVVGTLEAAKILLADGFEVFPYCTEDLTLARRLVDAGCRVVMPWGSQIGSGKGIVHEEALRRMRAELPGVALIIDAGLGAPSHAAKALEMGYDAVLLNTAVAGSGDPVKMAQAFKQAIAAGRAAFEAGMMKPREIAQASTPVTGTPFAAANARIS